MTQVFFYHGAANKLAAACTLLSKAANQKKPVLVYAPLPGQAADLDRLLWTQNALSFVPHSRAESPQAAESPILICETLDVLPQEDRLMNLGLEMPPNFSRFTSLIEVVGEADDDRAAARQRVRAYKDLGCEVQYFNLADDQ